MSFKRARKSVLLALNDNLLSEEEFLVLYDANKSKNLDLPCKIYSPFNLDDMEEDECINEFRVRKCDMTILADVLRIPNEIICDQRSVVGGVEALCMLLKRLTYPCRYSDMMQRFGHRQVPVLCMATNSMLDYIYAAHHQRITQWNDNILNPVALETYADCIHQMEAPLENCFGFIDGTVRPIARPGITQRILYNGHKHVHSLKYQAVAIPNGLIAHLYGPVEGKKHDSGMLAESGLMSLLENHAMSADGHPMCVYGDPAYPLRMNLQAPFRSVHLTAQMMEFNKKMSEVRVSVEWLFGDIANYFKFMDFKKNLNWFE